MNSAVVWQGPSALNGDPIRVVVSGLSRVSQNVQTGDMLTAWFLPDVAPIVSVRTGQDEAVCGTCPRRPSLAKASGVDACYVQTRNLGSLFRAVQRLEVEDITARMRKKRLALRLGGWGDPAAAPLEVLQRLCDAAEGHTGYTHAWREATWLRGLVMASVDSVAEAEEAQALGWHTFRVAEEGDPGPLRRLGEGWCPTVLHSRVTCALCKKCDASARNYVAPRHGRGRSKRSSWEQTWGDWTSPR